MNWERYSGDQVEEFIAALLLLRNPKGNRITPSQGDRGVDVQIRTESGGYEFYQIKRFSKSLAGSQKRQIKGSWRTFLEQTAPRYDVVSWNIVMPYDPNNQNLEWLNSFTGSSGIEVNWVGRAQLDAWAAEDPQLVEYYFGNGKTRTEELIEQALMLGRSSISDTRSEDKKIDALMEKATAIQKLLDEVDPFYRYEYEPRQGRPEALMHEMIRNPRAEEVFVSVTPLGDTGYNVVLHILARCAESCNLRPIGLKMTFEVDLGTDEHRALQKFLEFGLPPQNISAAISNYDGPPGGPSDGDGLVSLFEVAVDDDMLPPLEMEIIPKNSDVSAKVLDVKNVRHGMGISGGGSYLRMSDNDDVFTLTMLVTSNKELGDLSIERSPLAGRRPHDILHAIQFLEAFAGGGEMELRVRGGGPALIRIDVESPQDQTRAKSYHLFKEFIESLIEIQKQVFAPVLVPPVESCSDMEMRTIIRCARLLRGEQVVDTWRHFDVTMKDLESFQKTLGGCYEEGVLLWRENLVVKIGDMKMDTGYVLQTICKTVRIAEESRCEAYTPGAVIRFVPGEDDKVVMSAMKS